MPVGEAFGHEIQRRQVALQQPLGFVQMGCCPPQRLQMALSQLRQGTWRVYEVAEQNGFGDYKNFCAIFRKYMQASPREFMNQAAGSLHQGEEHEKL